MYLSRLDYIDIMKGIGIILVVLGHISYNSILITWIYSFHMPLFFLISGFLFYKSRKDGFIKRKLVGLLTPYFCFSLLTYFYWLIIERNMRDNIENPFNVFLGIFIAYSGNNFIFNIVMWFLPCLLVTECLFFLLHKNLKPKYLLITIVFISSVGYLYSLTQNMRLPWGGDVATISISFYGIGYFLAKYKNQIRFQLKISNTKKMILIFINLVKVDIL